MTPTAQKAVIIGGALLSGGGTTAAASVTSAGASPTVVAWVVGALGALVMALSGFWATAIYNRLRHIDEKLSRLDNFQGFVGQAIKDQERRITRLEDERTGGGQ